MNAALNNCGSVSFYQSLFLRDIKRREAAIETDGQLLAAFVDCTTQPHALFLGKRHRLLYEYMFTCLQSRQRLWKVVLVSAENKNCIDVLVSKHLVVV